MIKKILEISKYRTNIFFRRPLSEKTSIIKESLFLSFLIAGVFVILIWLFFLISVIFRILAGFIMFVVLKDNFDLFYEFISKSSIVNNLVSFLISSVIFVIFLVPLLIPIMFYSLLYYKREKIKKDILEKFALDNKMKMFSKSKKFIKFLSKFNFFKKAIEVENIIAKEGIFIFEGEIKEKMQFKNESAILEYECGAIFFKTKEIIPELRLSPEKYINFKDVDFESPEFNKRYRVFTKQWSSNVWHFFSPIVLHKLSRLKFPYYYIKLEKSKEIENLYLFLIYRKKSFFEMIDTKIEIEELFNLLNFFLQYIKRKYGAIIYNYKSLQNS